MAWHVKTMYDLIREDDNLSRQIEIIDNLYITEESQNKKIQEEAENLVLSLRDKKAKLQEELKRNRDEFRRRFLKLFE